MMLLEALIRDGRYLVTHQPIHYRENRGCINFPNSVAEDLGLDGKFVVERKKQDFSELVIVPKDCSDQECDAYQEHNKIKLKQHIHKKIPFSDGECVGLDIDLKKIDQDGILITRLDDYEIGELEVVKRHDYMDTIEQFEQ